MLYWDPLANDGEGGYQDDGVYGDTPSIDFGTNPLQQPNYAVDPNSDPENPLYGKDPTSSVEVLTPEERAAAVAAESVPTAAAVAFRYRGSCAPRAPLFSEFAGKPGPLPRTAV